MTQPKNGASVSQSANGAPEASVLIVDDHAPMRAAIWNAIDLAFPKLRVIEAPDGATALKHFDPRLPSFVVMDINLPDGNGLDLTRTIKKLCPATMIGVISIETNARIAAQALAAGAVAFIGKDRLFDELVPLIRAAVMLTEWMYLTEPRFRVAADSP